MRLPHGQTVGQHVAQGEVCPEPECPPIESISTGARTPAEQAALMGVDLVSLPQDRRSSNKFLGSENPILPEYTFKGKKRRGARNLNGYDAVQRAASQAKAAIKARLAEVMHRHGE